MRFSQIGIPVGSVFPINPHVGDMFYVSDGTETSRLMVYDGIDWKTPKQSISYSPINYSAIDSLSIDSHLAGIDDALSGGGGGPIDLNDLTDVDLSSLAEDEFLSYDGSKWVNSLVDWSQISGKPVTFAPGSHFHLATDVNSGTFADARVAESSVTQHQAALSITWSQITGEPVFVEEAPINGNLYARKNGAWEATLGVTDGDKGDISVSGAGATWTIDSEAVSPSKVSSALKTMTIGASFDGQGSAVTAGSLVYVRVPVACTITSATMLADQSGSAVVDVWVDTYANYPPTVADTVTAAAKPTLSAAIKSEDATLTGWATSVAAGSVVAFKVDSCTTITRLHIQLKTLRT